MPSFSSCVTYVWRSQDSSAGHQSAWGVLAGRMEPHLIRSLLKAQIPGSPDPKNHDQGTICGEAHRAQVLHGLRPKGGSYLGS